MISVKVVYALPGMQWIYEVRVLEGATIADAIAGTPLRTDHPDLDVASCRVGIFGRSASSDRPLREGDRVEIYRPLRADPKDARRTRARRGKPESR